MNYLDLNMEFDDKFKKKRDDEILKEKKKFVKAQVMKMDDQVYQEFCQQVSNNVNMSLKELKKMALRFQ